MEILIPRSNKFSVQNQLKELPEILDSVASNDGSGYRAVIDGYDVAGKTGTAEMVIDGKYSKEGEKRTYFVGFSPVINPKYIIAVRLDYPKKVHCLLGALSIKIRL